MGKHMSWRSMFFQHWVLVLTICIVGILILLPGSARTDETTEDAVLGPTDLGYSTYLGGVGYDECNSLKQFGGSAIVTGLTTSNDFPATPGSYNTTYNYVDVIVTRFNSNGSALIFSTILGGSDLDYGLGISVDDRGYIYVTGKTQSPDFPVIGGSFDVTYNGGGSDAYVSVLLPDGSDLLYSTFLGGTDEESATAIEVASGYRAIVTGYTKSTDFPTLGSWDKTYNGGGDCFVTALNAAGTSIVKSTFFGGSSWEAAYDSVISPSDVVSITGETASSDFPTNSKSFDKTYNVSIDAFLFCMNPFTQDLQGSTYFGGSDEDTGSSIAMGNDPLYVYITGYTKSTDFPTLNAYDGTLNGVMDVFVAKLFYNGENLINSTLLGGSDRQFGWGISVDNEGNAYVMGDTKSTDFPVTAAAFDQIHNGAWDVFFSLLHIGPSMSLHYSTFLGGSSYDYGRKAIDINGSYEVFVAGYTYSTDFPTTKYAFDTTYNGDGDGFVTKFNIPPPHVSIDLCQGLNLISYPYDDVTITNADALLNSICPGNADSIWKYDCSTKKFTSWTILDPGDGWAVSQGMPVWVNVTSPAGCTWVPPGSDPSGISYNTCVGLNLVTVPAYTTSITLASQMLADIPGCTAIYRYKKEVSCSNPGGFDGYFNISPPSDDFPVLRGHGYWASTTTAGTWAPPNP